MQLTTSGLADGQAIPGEFAFCIPDPAHHLSMGKNFNPQLAWNETPSNTKSSTLICHDTDVPSYGDDVNQTGDTVQALLPRVNNPHWALIDLPATVHCLNWGEFRQGVTLRGKPGAQTLFGNLAAPFGGLETRDAIKGQVRAEAALTGTYTLNSQLDYV